ncbi:hypothetical protein C6P42_002004 [Pichia californica]|nr:hypothetical protein C6P42_002004 [[Candida] californica]
MNNKDNNDNDNGKLDSEDLINLESFDSKLYKELIETLDDIIFKSINMKLEKEFNNNNDDSLIDNELENELSELKDFDPNILSNNGEFDLNYIENYFHNMVKIRNSIIEQELISNSFDDKTINKSNFENFYKLSKDKMKNINELSINIEKLKDLKISNKIKFEKILELISIQKNLKNNSLNSFQKSNISDNEIKEIKLKYKKLIGKNLMLGNFITDLIAALNCANISDDDKLLDMLMNCGDYTDYDLLNE